MAEEKKYEFHEETWGKIDTIISYLFREGNTNLAVDCGIVRDSLMATLIELKELKNGKRTIKVTACHNSMFHEIPCLENEEEYGFFKSEADIRPGHATWIKKEAAEKMYNFCQNLKRIK